MRHEYTHVIAAIFVASAFSLPSTNSPVADAAMEDDLAAVKALIEQGADVNAAQNDGMTALHWSALHDNVEMGRMLIYAGANLRATTRLGGYTALHLAGRNGHAAILGALLEAGSNPDDLTSTGVTALHLAASAGRPAAVQTLLDHGAGVDVKDSISGRTPLMFATAGDRTEVIETLLRAGADVAIATVVVDYAAQAEIDAIEQRKRERIMAAAREPQEEEEEDERRPQSVADASAAQLQSQEEPARQKKEREQKTPRDSTALQHVADASAAQLQSQEEDVELSGASDSTANEEKKSEEPEPLSYSDLVGKQGGMTALHYAARDGRLDAAKLLLDAGAPIDFRTPGDLSTPLLVAAINGNYDLAMMLLERGADPNLASEDGAAPLYAVLNNRWAPKALYPQPTAFKQQTTEYLEVMRALLERGADPNARLATHLWYTSFNFDLLGVDFQGATPFWRAAYATDVPAMKLLIAYGADPHIPTTKPAERRRRSRGEEDEKEDPSGWPPVPVGGPAVYPIHAASGVGYGVARAGNSHRHAPDG